MQFLLLLEGTVVAWRNVSPLVTKPTICCGIMNSSSFFFYMCVSVVVWATLMGFCTSTIALESPSIHPSVRPTIHRLSAESRIKSCYNFTKRHALNILSFPSRHQLFILFLDESSPSPNLQKNPAHRHQPIFNRPSIHEKRTKYCPTATGYHE